MKHSKKGFTLVELVVVAVILSILATVGFISYEEYITDTRDSKRLAQLTGLRDGLRLGITKGQLPLPDDNVEIRNNGTAFLYQGYAGKNVLEGISYSEATKDPLDDTYYTYLLSRNRKDFQLMGFLEEYNPNILSRIIPKGYAAEDYSQRFPQVMGKKLGIVLEQETNTPLQEISEYSGIGYMDLNDTTTNLFDAYVTDTRIISGKENALIGVIPFTTCKKIKENGDSYGTGYYSINPSGLDPIEVYCDMEIDGGGWTLVSRSTQSDPTGWGGRSTMLTGGNTGGDFGWLFSNGSIRDDSIFYSLGEQTKYLNFSDLLMTTYVADKTITNAYRYAVSSDIISNDLYHDGDTESEHSDKKDEPALTSCIEVLNTDMSSNTCTRTGLKPSFWGNVDYSYTYWFNFTSNYSDAASYSANSREINSGLMRGGYKSGYDGFFGDFGGKQGMIFVR